MVQKQRRRTHFPPHRPQHLGMHEIKTIVCRGVLRGGATAGKILKRGEKGKEGERCKNRTYFTPI